MNQNDLSTTPPGGISQELASTIDSSLLAFCTQQCSQFVHSEYNQAKRIAVNQKLNSSSNERKTQHFAPPLQNANANVISHASLSTTTSALFTSPHEQDENNRSNRPSSPNKRFDDSDTPPIPTSGRISPSRPSFRDGRSSPTRSSSPARPHNPSPIVSTFSSPVLDPVETPLVSTRPFSLGLRSHSSSELPPTSPSTAHATGMKISPSQQRMPIARPAPFPAARPTPSPRTRSQTAIHEQQQQPMKTSHTHPMHISAMLPEDRLAEITFNMLSNDQGQSSSIVDFSNWYIAQSFDSDFLSHKAPSATIGNLYLSSCPGKKVRLTGPIIQGGRSAICRDLKIDLLRVASKPFNVKVVVCCLDDAELEFLGVPWSEYEPTARQLGLQVVRIPLSEGYAPEDIAEIDSLTGTLIRNYTMQGHSILVHCRGGVGRAGSIAVCWYAKLGLAGQMRDSSVNDLVKNAVQWIRQRRSPKAIETPVQVLFVYRYLTFLHENALAIPARLLIN